MSASLLDIPTGSAVLLMHNPHGGFPIASPNGSISQGAAHALAYDGRKDEFEEKGGCDREPTERDTWLAGNLKMAGEASSHLDYVAREGAWEARRPGMAEDCTYWGQHGPLSRDEIEYDMLACGGCYLKSVVSVDRRYAAQLNLDTKAAFQELVRNNWQDMMVAAGVASRPEDVHWYACYHTDAENSLHVHISTWSADGRIEEGWHPSARSTREQKAILYRDAYAPLRMQRNREQDYYRMLLPKLAAAEMGERMPAKVCEKLRGKAEKAGVGEVPLERTLNAKGADEVAKAAETVTERLRGGRGLKSHDWKLQSDAGKVVKAIRRNSPAFDAALSRYRQLAEDKANIAGLALARPRPEAESNRMSKQEREREESARSIIKHERDRFVRREMDDIMRRIRNQVIRSADPEARVRALAREGIDHMRHKLVTASLRPEQTGLAPGEADRLRAIYREAADAGSRAGESATHGAGPEEAMPPERALEAASIIASSPMAQAAARNIAHRLAAESSGAVDGQTAEQMVGKLLAPRIADAIKWRFDSGHVEPRHVARDRPLDPPDRHRQADEPPTLGIGDLVATTVAAIIREQSSDNPHPRTAKANRTRANRANDRDAR